MSEKSGSNNQTILIASCSADAPNWGPIASDLSDRGYEVIPFEAVKVAQFSVFNKLINR